MSEECKLCGGVGRVVILVPNVAPEKGKAYSDCPCCIERIWVEEEGEAEARIAELERQLENERVRLSACGSAALGYFEGCKDEYKSASLDDVLRLRERADLLQRQQAVLSVIVSQAIALHPEWEAAKAALAAVKPSPFVPPKPNHQIQSLIEAARCLGVAQAKGDHTQHLEQVVTDLSAALNAAVKPAGQKGGDRG